MSSNKLLNNKGFTLIELLTVIAILTILMGIAVFNPFYIRDKAALNVDVDNAKLIKNNIDIYHNINGEWPQALSDIIGRGKYLPALPKVQSRKSEFRIGNDGTVQVLSDSKVYWCSNNSNIPIDNTLK